MFRYYFYLCEDATYILNVLKLFSAPDHPRYIEASRADRRRYNKLYAGHAVPLDHVLEA